MHARNDSITTPKDEMRTPPSLFKKLDDRFHFNVDAACTVENCLCKFGFAKNYQDTDALTLDWCNLFDFEKRPIIYCNPPYSRGNLLKFTKKCYLESLRGATVVMLLPVDFSTAWWDWCMLAAEWIRIKGRVHFNGIDNQPILGSPLFDSVVVIFDAKQKRERGFVLSEMGWK